MSQPSYELTKPESKPFFENRPGGQLMRRKSSPIESDAPHGMDRTKLMLDVELLEPRIAPVLFT